MICSYISQSLATDAILLACHGRAFVAFCRLTRPVFTHCTRGPVFDRTLTYVSPLVARILQSSSDTSRQQSGTMQGLQDPLHEAEARIRQEQHALTAAQQSHDQR